MMILSRPDDFDVHLADICRYISQIKEYRQKGRTADMYGPARFLLCRAEKMQDCFRDDKTMMRVDHK